MRKHEKDINKISCFPYQIVAEDHGRKPVGESVPLKQMKEIV